MVLELGLVSIVLVVIEIRFDHNLFKDNSCMTHIPPSLHKSHLPVLQQPNRKIANQGTLKWGVVWTQMQDTECR